MESSTSHVNNFLQSETIKHISYRAAAILLFASALFVAREVPAESAQAVTYAGYNLTTGDYPYWDAATVKSASSDYSVNGNITNPTGFDYRNCTDYAHWRVTQEFGTAIARIMRPLGNPRYSWRDAGNWDNAAKAAKFKVIDTKTNKEKPEPGDLAIWDGTASNPAGHVEFVDSVNTDGTVNTAGYNKRVTGKFERRGKIYKDDAKAHTAKASIVADHYIDLNGKNTDDFKLKLYAKGESIPKSVNEVKAEKEKRLFDAIPDHSYMRVSSQGGSEIKLWIRKEGKNLHRMGDDYPSYPKAWNDNVYTSNDLGYTYDFFNKRQVSKTYTYDQRAADVKTGKLDPNNPISKPITDWDLTEAGKKLGFAKIAKYTHYSNGDFITNAKDIRFVGYGQCYLINSLCPGPEGYNYITTIDMDLVAKTITGRQDVIAYATDWGDARSWKIYQRPTDR
jgi:surface antigen